MSCAWWSNRERLLGRLLILALLMGAVGDALAAGEPTTARFERMIEIDVQSKKHYRDPFNDVDIDVIFTRDGQSWRVPMFWRGDRRWTVRFAPPTPGSYAYQLESTDRSNPDLNGHPAAALVTPYLGSSDLLKHGMPRVSNNKRYFEFPDHEPFYWLGDTWWTGLSDRLPWTGFQELAEDRKNKGFTVVQVCAGLIPGNEELAPVDPGYSNEGGAVWDAHFERINPRYFDYADRRIEYLVNAGMVPAIVGAWSRTLREMGIAKMKKHWRYIVARYGAYPVFWVGGGEVYDPPADQIPKNNPLLTANDRTPGWTDIVRYIRAIDPYRHPLTVHEMSDVSLQDVTLTDFDFAQPSHWGWASIGYEVSQLNIRYSRTNVTKPFVVAEIGYEMIGNTHLDDFQRVAFWLAMLNGAAGHSYGAAPVFEANNPDKPLHRLGQYTFLSWQEGMRLPGSYQVGLGAKLLRQYPWWDFSPHPEWVTPHGTTLLGSPSENTGVEIGNPAAAINADFSPSADFIRRPETVFPGGEWEARQGTFRQPYAAGIPKRVRVIYIPYFGVVIPPPPTVLGLESDVTYHAYYWEPTLGIRFDLGSVAVPTPGELLTTYQFDDRDATVLQELGSTRAQREAGKLVATGDTLSVSNKINVADASVSVDGSSDSGGGVVLRYSNVDNYDVALFSAKEKLLYIYRRVNAHDGRRLGAVAVPALEGSFRLSAEIRSNMMAASISDGVHAYQTQIVDILDDSPWAGPSDGGFKAGAVGLIHPNDGNTQKFGNFEVRRSAVIPAETHLERKLYDAQGMYRGELTGPRWSEFGVNKAILLNAYRPERFPSLQDWVLILEAAQ